MPRKIAAVWEVWLQLQPQTETGTETDHREAEDDARWEVRWAAWCRSRPCGGPGGGRGRWRWTPEGRRWPARVPGLAGRGGTWEGAGGTSRGSSNCWRTPSGTCWGQAGRPGTPGWRSRRSCPGQDLQDLQDLRGLHRLRSRGTLVLHWGWEQGGGQEDCSRGAGAGGLQQGNTMNSGHWLAGSHSHVRAGC